MVLWFWAYWLKTQPGPIAPPCLRRCRQRRGNLAFIIAAQVVVVRADNDGLVFELGVGAGR